MQNKGYDASGIRRFNERLILTSLGKQGAYSKTELAKLTNLTTQGVMRIVNDLREQGLVRLKHKRITGKGRPSEMLELDPKGAYSIGIMVGRREIKMMLMNICGNTLAYFQQAYDYPEPFEIVSIIEANLSDLISQLSISDKTKIKGLGVAMPWFLGKWSDGQEMPKEVGAIWEKIDFAALIASKVEYPVLLTNDCSAAAGAELLFGEGKSRPSFLYIYIDSFIGGGLVINGNLHQGKRGNAAALASYPVSHSKSPSLSTPKKPFEILLNRSSLMSLIDYLNFSGANIANIEELQLLIDQDFDRIEHWLDDCCEALAEVVISYSALLDLDNVLIDINLDGNVLKSIVERVNIKTNSLLERDLHKPKISCGSLGKNAVVIGGAILPFYSNFVADRSVVFHQQGV